MEYPTTHLNFLVDTRVSGDCVNYQENTGDKWDSKMYTTRECCVTILYLGNENTTANKMNVTYAWRMMGRKGVIYLSVYWLSCILIGRIFYGVYKSSWVTAFLHLTRLLTIVCVRFWVGQLEERRWYLCYTVLSLFCFKIFRMPFIITIADLPNHFAVDWWANVNQDTLAFHC